MLERIKPITYPVGVINDEWRTDYPRIHGTPTWFLVDRQGVIRKVVIGKQTITAGWFDGLKGDLERLLPKRIRARPKAKLKQKNDSPRTANPREFVLRFRHHQRACGDCPDPHALGFACVRAAAPQRERRRAESIDHLTGAAIQSRTV